MTDLLSESKTSRFRRWLNDSEVVSRVWLARPCILAAWLGLALASFSSPNGGGPALCWLKLTTGIPCPGCGLTRSLSCGLHGRFFESWQFHPLGLVILALFLFTAAQSVLPLSWRARLRGFLQVHPLPCNTVYLAFVIAFVGFGIVRAALRLSSVILGGDPGAFADI